MLEVYSLFKKRIIDGRGKRLKGKLENLAGGRIYSGKNAHTLGLVDALGGLNQAIQYTIKLLPEDDLDIHLLPEPKSAIDGIFAQPNKDSYEFIQVAKPDSTANIIQQYLLSNQNLNLLDNHKLQQIDSFINRLHAIQNQQILLLAPTMSIR
jgi:protease-4